LSTLLFYFHIYYYRGDFIKRLIQKYINKITENDIEMFAAGNNIKLNSHEKSVVYHFVKNHYNDLVYGNSNLVFNSLKQELSSENYNKIYYLFNSYKEKYKHYL